MINKKNFYFYLFALVTIVIFSVIVYADSNVNDLLIKSTKLKVVDTVNEVNQDQFYKLLKEGKIENRGMSLNENIDDVIKKYGTPKKEFYDELNGEYIRTFNNISTSVVTNDPNSKIIKYLKFEEGYGINKNMTGKEILRLLGTTKSIYKGTENSDDLGEIFYNSGDYILGIKFNSTINKISDLYYIKPYEFYIIRNFL